jgi:hypothetical protein
MGRPLSVIPKLGLLLLLVGCGSDNAADPPDSRVYRVLFIGNSLTYVNDLPGTVARLAASVGDSFEVQSVAEAGFALIDHVNGKSDAVAVVQSRPWDYVVLQQGPSSLPLSRDTLVLATQLLDPYIRGAGARPAELMVWPAADNPTAFDAVRGSYQEAAQAVNGLFLPAGEAWRAAWALYPMLALYGSDGFHPSEVGTYLTALVVLEGITGRDVESLPPFAFAAGRQLDTPPGVVRLMQRAAHETVARFPSPAQGSSVRLR